MNIEKCKANQYCTNCPERIGCEGRPKLYSSVEEFYGACLAAARIAFIIGKMSGKEDCTDEIMTALQKLHKKRAKELEEHPTYSAI